MTDGDLILGVDGGGTKTAVLLGRVAGAGFSVLGTGTAGPSNPRAVGMEPALEQIHLGIGRAFEAAGLPRCTVVSACIALAGAGRDVEQKHIVAWAGERGIAAKTVVTHDADGILAAGTPEGWGVAVIAGTGSMAFGRDRTGRDARAGGWGYLLGDEGSAYRLVLDGLAAAVRFADGRAGYTELLEQFLRRLGREKPHELVEEIYAPRWDRAALAGLAEVVTNCADVEDAVALGIVHRAADDLAEAIVAVARRLALEGAPVPLALTGGLLLAYVPLSAQLTISAAARGVELAPQERVLEPVRGALALARRAV